MLSRPCCCYNMRTVPSSLARMKALQHRTVAKECNQASDTLSTEVQGAHHSPRIGVSSAAFFGLENKAW